MTDTVRNSPLAGEVEPPDPRRCWRDAPAAMWSPSDPCCGQLGQFAAVGAEDDVRAVAIQREPGVDGRDAAGEEHGDRAVQRYGDPPPARAGTHPDLRAFLGRPAGNPATGYAVHPVGGHGEHGYPKSRKTSASPLPTRLMACCPDSAP